LHLALGSLACLDPGGGCAAAEPLTTSEQQEFNYAFATQIGSGIYDISGRRLQVYSLPLAVTFRPSEESRAGWRFIFPMTFGFIDFNQQDVLESGLPENVSTVSLVPGVEFLVPIQEHWLLKPFVQAGYVWDRSGDAGAATYSAGLHSRFDFSAGGFNSVLGNGLTYSLVVPTSRPGRDSMVAFETAFTASHLLGQGGESNADYEPYFVGRLYFGGLDEPLTSEAPTTLAQYEVGVTFGSREPVKLWKIPLPRVGLSYVFGQDLSVIRIVFGAPAASLKP
jgi:hypothetical protein